MVVFTFSQLEAWPDGLRPLQRGGYRLERPMEILIIRDDGLHIIDLKASETWPSFLWFDELKLKALRFPRMSSTDSRIRLSSGTSQLRNRWYIQRLDIHLSFYPIRNTLRWFKLFVQTQALFLGVSALLVLHLFYLLHLQAWLLLILSSVRTNLLCVLIWILIVRIQAQAGIQSPVSTNSWRAGLILISRVAERWRWHRDYKYN